MNTGAGGSDMSVEDVVGFWPQIEEAANNNGVETLVGPNVANVDAAGWYSNFFDQCPDCRVDAIGIHSYGCTVEDLQWEVGQMQQFGRPLWLTEFSCADNPQAIEGNDDGSKDWNWQCEFMKQAIPYLEGEESIVAYAWFSFNGDYPGQSSLVEGGQLTELGNCYNDLIVSMKNNSTKMTKKGSALK